MSAVDVAHWTSSERASQFLSHLAGCYPKYSYRTLVEGSTLRVVSRGRGHALIGEVTTTPSAGGTQITTRVDPGARRLVLWTIRSVVVGLVGIGLLATRIPVPIPIPFPAFGTGGGLVSFMAMFGVMGGIAGAASLLGLPSSQRARLRSLNRGLLAAGAAYRAPAGWYEDPTLPDRERWWDGDAWANRERARSPERTLARRRLTRARVLGPVFFFSLLFGLPVLLTQLN